MTHNIKVAKHNIIVEINNVLYKYIKGDVVSDIVAEKYPHYVSDVNFEQQITSDNNILPSKPTRKSKKTNHELYSENTQYL